jgi:hypothetical protein
MKNCFAAGLRRFADSPLLLLSLFLCAADGLVVGLISCQERFPGTYVYTPDYAVIGTVIALFLVLCSVVNIISREHADGALRLKVIAGCSKSEIAGALLLLSLLASLLLGGLYLLPFWLLVRRALVLSPTGTPVRALLVLLLMFLTVGAVSVMLSLLMRRQAVTVLTVLGCAIAMTVVTLALDAQLLNPEYDVAETYLPNKEGIEDPVAVQFVRRYDFYLASPKRELAIVFVKLLPTEHMMRALNVIAIEGDQLQRQREIEEAKRLQEELRAWGDGLREDGDPDGVLWRERIFLVDTVENISDGQAFTQDARDEVHWAPQCMLGILLLISALGIAAFRKKDLI